MSRNPFLSREGSPSHNLILTPIRATRPLSEKPSSFYRRKRHTLRSHYHSENAHRGLSRLRSKHMITSKDGACVFVIYILGVTQGKVGAVGGSTPPLLFKSSSKLPPFKKSKKSRFFALLPYSLMGVKWMTPKIHGMAAGNCTYKSRRTITRCWRWVLSSNHTESCVFSWLWLVRGKIP